MADLSQIAAAIDLRVRQLGANGITGLALANHMIGHMQDLQRIYDTASDRTLRDLCRRFPGFERYAMLMEQVSEQNQAMLVEGTHPYGGLPELPERQKASLLHVLRGASEIERLFQAAVDDRRYDQDERLTAMTHRWADELEKLVHEFRLADLPLETQALVQQVVKAAAQRIEELGRKSLDS